ncbi:MAG: Gfo/Idh/MocA family oxidoreductase [Victivallaceae bacterium]|nr:Gfo/Idh/MocA family oxidoreductase [Victivallaceae bacterium]
MKKLKFGLIGCGMIVEKQHLPQIIADPRKMTVTALWDCRHERAATLAAKFSVNAKICGSLPELLNTGVDAVVVATPNSLHYEHAAAALSAGRHTLLEKPMTTNLEEADRLIELAAQHQLVLKVNQSFHYMPLYCEIARRLAAGAIGELRHVRCLRGTSTSPDKGWAPGSDWFVKKEFAGGIVGDIGIHMVEMLQWCCGQISSIQALVHNYCHEVPDHFAALLNFTSGATGILEISWVMPESVFSLEIYGTKGVLRVNRDQSGFTISSCGGKRIAIINAAQLPKCRSGILEFLSDIQNGSTDAWRSGRDAIALVDAINRAATSEQAEIPYQCKNSFKTINLRC